MPDGLPRVAVIGAGAAGLIAALFAARAGSQVVLLESTPDGGRKIVISGGGRCNILPAAAAPERFVTDSSPNTLRKMLRSWPLSEQVRFFERELQMRLVLEDSSGKLFPESQQARDVRDRLLQRAREAGVQLWFEARVTGLRPPAAAGGSWTVELAGAPPLLAARVVLATGGLSVPATGSDGTGLRLAATLGHRIHPTYPALTPLLASPHPHRHLAGVSLPVTLAAPGSRPAFTATGGFLFTHRGYSGPAVLDASHLATRARAAGAHASLRVRWASHDVAHWERTLVDGRGSLRRRLEAELPARLAQQLIAEAGIASDHSLAELSRADRKRLCGLLGDYELPWTGDEGYRKAEVTGGGVDLGEVDARTLQSRRCPGVYLCGEILDAFGPIGGHNFHWAWTTGRLAGLGAAA